MKQVMTVRGPVDPGELGFTSMHEHVLADGRFYVRRFERLVPAEHRAAMVASLPEDVRSALEGPISLATSGLLRGNPVLHPDNMLFDDEETMAAELADFRDSGGRTVVEMSAVGLRTDMAGLRRLSERTGVHIVACTGFYVEECWPEAVRSYTVDDFRRFMVDELREGIAGTDVRPGHIKLAVMELSAGEERALRGGAQAALETGALVSVHPGFEIGSDGRRIVRILTEEGLPPERIVIAHGDSFFLGEKFTRLALDPASWGLKLDYHRALLEHGVNISIDCFGHDWSVEALDWVLETDWQRVGGLVALVREGYSQQLVVGADVFCKMLTRRGGGRGYCRLTRWLVPTLRGLGVSDFDVRQLTELAPARLLPMDV